MACATGSSASHLKERRCVIPCEGFYEWRDEGGKQPYYFSRKDSRPLMLAGIWEIAEYKGDSRIAFAILTDEPNELVASYHDRMPLALAEDKVDAWLDLSIESQLDENLLLDLKEFTVRPMDRAMNNVRQKNLAAIDPEAAGLMEQPVIRASRFSQPKSREARRAEAAAPSAATMIRPSAAHQLANPRLIPILTLDNPRLPNRGGR